MVPLVRHRQTKESATDRLNLNHRVTPRLHTFEVILYLSGLRVYQDLMRSNAQADYGITLHDVVRKVPVFNGYDDKIV
jgi:hypothetical protein